MTIFPSLANVTVSPNLQKTLARALEAANARNYDYATLEHLLLALTDDPDAKRVMEACQVDLDKLRKDLTIFTEEDLAGLRNVYEEVVAKPAAGFQRVVQGAAIHVESSGNASVTGANILLALFSQRESHAVYFLQTQDMTRLDAVNFMAHGISKPPRSPKAQIEGSFTDASGEVGGWEKLGPALEEFARLEAGDRDLALSSKPDDPSRADRIREKLVAAARGSSSIPG